MDHAQLTESAIVTAKRVDEHTALIEAQAKRIDALERAVKKMKGGEQSDEERDETKPVPRVYASEEEKEAALSVLYDKCDAIWKANRERNRVFDAKFSKIAAAMAKGFEEDAEQ